MMMMCITAVLFDLTAADTCDSDHHALLLRLNQDLLRSTENQESPPNPSIHIALRLSPQHNLVKETQYLNQLKTKFHKDIQSTLDKRQPVLGRLALYVMALKASCHDLSSVSLLTNEKSEPLLTHLKKQMEAEKDHIAFAHRPLTNYYQYSLGILALCVSGVRVNPHVSHKLTHAALHNQFKHDDTVSVDTLAMAGMALQCLKEGETQVKNKELEQALTTIKQKLLESQRADGHLGNEFSTGLAVQALLAMGNNVDECGTSMTALRSDARKGSYHNAMAISQTLPALQQRSYLHLKNKECLNESDSLVLEPVEVVLSTLPDIHVQVNVEVVKADGSSSNFQVNVPSGSSLFESLTLLQHQQTDFKFEKEDSLWGPFLSVVNGEQARQSDRRYWHIASDGKGLSQGIKDYKIEAAQKITIKNTAY
ncbi:transcobalamin-2 precursor [Silurus asotus]|uniref:Transcobalamin-2 n=1 Tax=Silurus asotus TaxID=30991 RepID=A0AAD5AAY5_SILAS|nr:transcobalamin-2 precursor [Silurus asotus]